MTAEVALKLIAEIVQDTKSSTPRRVDRIFRVCYQAGAITPANQSLVTPGKVKEVHP